MNDLRKTTIKIPMKSIYVVENEHGMVKIGVSQNVTGRIATLSKQGGFNVNNLYQSKACSNAYKIENHIHKKLKANSVKGEWFKIEFETAVEFVDSIFKDMANFSPLVKKCITPEDIEQAFRRSIG